MHVSCCTFVLLRFYDLTIRAYFHEHLSENSRRLWLSEIPCWKSFPANFDAAGKIFTGFPAAPTAIPAKVWAFSGKENGCWKIGGVCGNAPGFSPPRPPQPSWVFLNLSCPSTGTPLSRLHFTVVHRSMLFGRCERSSISWVDAGTSSGWLVGPRLRGRT